MTDIARALCNSTYFKWWYFDVCCDSGHDIVLIYHVKPFFSHFDIGLADIVVYRDNRKIFHHAIICPLQQCALSAAPLSLCIGAAGLTAQDGGVACRVDDPAVQLALDFDTRGSGGAAEALCADDSGQDGFWWKINSAQAPVRGRVRYGGENLRIEGIGYHDCNWGTISVPRDISSWSWGRYMLDGEVLVYGTVRDRRQGVRALCVHADARGAVHTRYSLFNHRNETAVFCVPPASFDLAHTSQEVIDEDAICIPPLSGQYRHLSRCAEYVFYSLKKYRLFRPLCERISNVRYTRIKKQFRCNNHLFRHSMHEEMIVG